MIETIIFNGKEYPKFQSEGFAAKFAFPFAKEILKGTGVDVGCNRLEWSFPGSFPVDPVIDLNYNAMALPSNFEDANGKWDYIFSSHCLEHVPDWTKTLNYWKTMLKDGGILFLYLPHYSQEYWRTWNNQKHIHNLHPSVMRDYFEFTQWSKIFVSENDLNNSFYVVVEK